MNKKPIKLNLGSGQWLMKGFINVDAFFDLKDLYEAKNANKGYYRGATLPKGAKFVRGDVRKLPFPENYADYILFSHCIEHLSFDDVITALKECYRVLKPDGYLCVLTNELAGITLDFINWLSHGQTDADGNFDMDGYMFHMQGLFGGQMTPGEFHFCGFTPKFLNYCLAVVGFKDGELGIIKKGSFFPTKYEGIGHPNRKKNEAVVARNDQIFAYVKK